MTARTDKARQAERRAIGGRIRECFDGARTHIRAGSWHGLENADVTFVGMPAQLHGTVCTDCKGSVNYRED